MPWIKVKYPITNQTKSFKVNILSDTLYQDIKDQTKTFFKLDCDFYYHLIDNKGEKIVINESNQLLEYIQNTSIELEVISIDVTSQVASMSVSSLDKPQFDILCDGCYTPIRGQRYRCETCEDFDLCSICKSRVNHNPSHQFQLLHDTISDISSSSSEAIESEQGVESKSSVMSTTHTIYICDNCDSDIVGIRHTCSSCPDFDLCHSCFSIVKQNHPEQHNFATHLAGADLNRRQSKKQQTTIVVEETTSSCDSSIPIQHIGIQCNMCESQVIGIRYKCGHCANFDLCSKCEEKAEYIHDKTHAFIKLRYPIKHISKKPLLPIFTSNENTSISSLSSSTATMKTIETNSILEVEIPNGSSDTVATPEPSTPLQDGVPKLEATLICDINIPEGTITKPKEKLVKMWKVKNTGNVDWPVGSNLIFNGGTILSFYPNGQPKLFAVPSLPIGEEASITAELQAPASAGHYTSYFCLCTPDGVAFSNNIWCTIVVVDDPTKIFPSPSTSSSMVFPSPSTTTSMVAEEEDTLGYDADEYDSYSTTTGEVSNTTATYTDSQISCCSPDDESVSERCEIYVDEPSDQDEVHSVSLNEENQQPDSQSLEDFVLVDEYDGTPSSPVASSIHSISTVTPQATEITPTQSIHEDAVDFEAEADSLEHGDGEDLRKKELALKRLVKGFLK